MCKLERKSDGYGFHLTGEAGRPGQFIKEVQANSAAEEGGLRDGDKIIEVNGNSVIGETHDDIVKRITENKNEVRFKAFYITLYLYDKHTCTSAYMRA